MKRSGLVSLIVFLALTHLNGAVGEDCSKCSCTTYPVPKGCESCCRLSAARNIIQDLINSTQLVIPNEVAAKATCVAVVPGSKRSGFVFGDEISQGVVTCRTSHGWSGPAFIRIKGGSFGFHTADQATDLLFVAVSNRGFQDMLKDKFTIGANASASGLRAYSRARGIFEGVDLDGTSIIQDREATDDFYGSRHSFDDILEGRVPPPDGAGSFLHAVADYFRNSSYE